MDHLDIVLQILKIAACLVATGLFIYFCFNYLKLESENAQNKIKLDQKEIESRVDKLSLPDLVKLNNSEPDDNGDKPA